MDSIKLPARNYKVCWSVQYERRGERGGERSKLGERGALFLGEESKKLFDSIFALY
jgi:hypothetical protein